MDVPPSPTAVKISAAGDQPAEDGGESGGLSPVLAIVVGLAMLAGVAIGGAGALLLARRRRTAG